MREKTSRVNQSEVVVRTAPDGVAVAVAVARVLVTTGRGNPPFGALAKQNKLYKVRLRMKLGSIRTRDGQYPPRNGLSFSPSVASLHRTGIVRRPKTQQPPPSGSSSLTNQRAPRDAATPTKNYKHQNGHLSRPPHLTHSHAIPAAKQSTTIP